MTRTNRTRRLSTGRIAAVTTVVTLLAPAVAHAHGAPTAHSAAAEKRLKTFERRALGSKHADEHASARALVRSRAGRRELSRVARRLKAQQRKERTTARASAAPQVDGQWLPKFDLPVFAIHSSLLPTGKVLLFAYPYPRELTEGKNQANAYLWDPRAGTGPAAFKQVNPPVDPRTGKTVNIWCAGQSLMGDGQLLVTGGNLAYETGTTTFKGLNHAYTFNPFTEQWTEQPKMEHGRWYPTQTLLPDGRTLIMSGDNEEGVPQGSPAKHNMDVELFTPSPDGGRGTMTKLLTRGTPGNPPDGGLYPHVSVMPSGKALIGGPTQTDSWLLNPLGSSPLWTDVPGDSTPAADYGGTTNPIQRYAGTSVLLPSAPGVPGVSSQVMQIGGGGGQDPQKTADPLKSTATFDENDAGAGWKPGAAMKVGRTHHNTVLLPGGDMVTVGGGLGARQTGDQWATDIWDVPKPTQDQQRSIEIYDRQSNAWRQGPKQDEPRAYHSTALLRPDGSVMSGGDDINGGPGNDGTTKDTAEIYEPPYLFAADGGRAARPSIASAPDSVTWDQTFRVGTGDDVRRAVLVAPGAVTHANDMSQRHVELDVVGRAPGQAIDVRAPANANVAPPGYYMLFLLDARGTPSVAKWMRVGTPTTAGPVPAPVDGSTPGATPTGAGAPAPAKPKGTSPSLKLTMKFRLLRSPTSRGRAVLRLRATANRASTVRLTASLPRTSKRRKRRQLASTRVTLRAGAGRVVSLRLSERSTRLAAGQRVVIDYGARDARGLVAKGQLVISSRR